MTNGTGCDSILLLDDKFNAYTSPFIIIITIIIIIIYWLHIHIKFKSILSYEIRKIENFE